MDELWLRDGVLPDDERILARVCGDATAWPRVRVAVMAHFEAVPGGWGHPTQLTVMKQARYLHGVRGAAGKAGAEARWQTNGKRRSNNQAKVLTKT